MVSLNYRVVKSFSECSKANVSMLALRVVTGRPQWFFYIPNLDGTNTIRFSVHWGYAIPNVESQV